jgi:tRNA(Ile)-lysidine synthase
VDDCTRNKLRLNIIPQLKEIFTSPERCGARLALSAKEDNDFISSEAGKLLEEKEKEIKLSSIRSAPPSLSKRAISIAYNRFSGGNLEASHLNILLDFARSEKNGEISLPLRTRAIFENEYMRFETESEQKEQSLSYCVPLLNGMNVIDGTDFAVCLSQDGCSGASSENYTAYATASLPKTDQGLLARSRREGDSILCGGMHKKIKKIMCDKKIPTSLRSSLPIICQGDEILFVPKCAVADKVKQEKNSGHITVTIYKRNES